jgi:hypothetical protein
MSVDPEFLRAHDNSLTDEELLRIGETDLVPEARDILDAELVARDLPRSEYTPPDPDEVVYLSGVRRQPLVFLMIPIRGWLGFESLWRVYWLVVVPGCVIIIALLSTFRDSPWFFAPPICIFGVWAVVAVWRCRRNVRAENWWAGRSLGDGQSWPRSRWSSSWPPLFFTLWTAFWNRPSDRVGASTHSRDGGCLKGKATPS